MYISVYDAGAFILFVIAVVVSVYLIAVLRRIFGVLGHLQGLLDKHDDDISKSLSLLPGTLANINDITESLKITLEQTGEALCTVQEELIDKVQYFQDGLETVLLYAKIAGEVMRSVFNWRSK